MKKSLHITVSLLALAAFVVSAAPVFAAENGPAQVVQKANLLLKDMTGAKNGVPRDVLQKAAGVVILPDVFNAGFIVGGQHGTGVLLERTRTGTWSDPVFVSLSGGSVGAQVGVTSTNFVLVVRDRDTLQHMLKGNFALGANVGVAAGPGASASASTSNDAGVFVYKETQGVFAGATISGGVLEINNGANTMFYNRKNVTPTQILEARVSTPHVAMELKQTLNRYSAVG